MRQLPFGKPIIGDAEKHAVLEVLDGPILVHGPRAESFETAFAEFTGAPHAVSVSSCTAALHLAYFHLGIGPGDEVIIPAQTHTATAHAIEYTGARAVFVDSEIQTGNIDIDQIENYITENTRALSVVHYLGMPVDMDRVNAIAVKHGLFVLEDCALAIGTYFKNKHAGLHGDAGCFSFYPVKHMTTAEGGMFITQSAELAKNIRFKKAFGVTRHHGQRQTPGLYDINALGFNYRMNEIQAAIGIEQLKRIGHFLKQRYRNYMSLQKELSEIEEIDMFQSSHGSYQSSYYCLSILLKDAISDKRYEMIRYLKENGVGTSIYYPNPVPYMSYYRDKYDVAPDSYPVASRISRNSIALPVGPHLDLEDMGYIADVCKKAIHGVT